MDNKDTEIDSKVDHAWAAGLMSSSGSMFLLNDVTVQYVLSSSNHPESVDRFAEIMGLSSLDGARGSRRVTLSGKPLHRVMGLVWGYLTKERKLEYAKLRKAAKQGRGESW